MTDQKKKINWKNIGLGLIFVLGLLIAAYPTISNWYYTIQHNEDINTFREAKEEIDTAELQRRLEIAREYNRTLNPARLSDPYTDKEEEAIAEYARMLEVREMIGHVEIPKINQNLPVYAGTSEQVLQRAVGHLEGTSLPVGGESTHAVITAHRGLAEAKLFRELDKMEVGDVFYFHNIAEVLAYEVDQIITVEPWDFEPVLVTEGEDYFTLLTCTPYMINSHRLLVRGHRIDYVPPVRENPLNAIIRSTRYKDLLPLVLLVLMILLVLAIRLFRDYRKTVKKVEDYRNED